MERSVKVATPDVSGRDVVPPSAAPGAPFPGTSEAKTLPEPQETKLSPSSKKPMTGWARRGSPGLRTFPVAS